MAIDAKKTLQKLRGEETKKGKVTLYLDRELYSHFKKTCDDVAPSRVIEELMRDFVQSAKKSGK